MPFQCKESGCILYSLVCDGIPHCAEGSDEFCGTSSSHANVIYDYFICDDSSRIPLPHVNDLIPDCPGAEDETEYRTLISYATDTKDKCPSGHLSCIPGHSKCFPIFALCLFDIDVYNHTKYCRDASHLEFCDNVVCTASFKCPGSYCIPYRKVCDGIKDCSYGEDETICDSIT